jgi:predicted peptidase
MKAAGFVARLLSIFLLAGCAPHRAVRYDPLPSGLQQLRVPLSIPSRSDSVSLLFYVPDHEEGQLLPAVLYLHGGSQRGTDLDRLKSYGPAHLIAQGHDLPFILIAPQLPDGEIWTDVDGLMRLVNELGQHHPIDPDRIYVTGSSMGARGAWYLAFRFPDRIAAIAPVATFQPILHWATSGRMCAVAVRAYHGDQDDLAPVAGAVRMHEAMAAAGGVSELKVLHGRDHFVADVLHDPELYRWLLEQRRSRHSLGMPCAP